MRTERVFRLGRVSAWVGGGFYGVQVPGWQIDLRDHRKMPPLFSARELGYYCGRHFGHWCLRTGRMTSPSGTGTYPTSTTDDGLHR